MASKLLGEQYGAPVANANGRTITMFRGPRQACRFYDKHGRRVGPEQRNVAPATAWAMAHGFTHDAVKP